MKPQKNKKTASTGVQIPSFSRIAWRRGFEEKQQVLQRWAEEFNRAELSTVIEKERECGIYLIEAAKYQEECLNFNRMGLVFLPIQKGVLNLALSLPLFKETQYIRCVVSYSEKSAQELIECLHSGGINCTAKIGKFLGYPSCCTNFFKKYSLSKNTVDPIFAAAQNTRVAFFDRGSGPDGKGTPRRVPAETVFINDVFSETNIILRNFGVKTIPHIPCSFDCRESQEFSKKFLKFMPSQNSLLEFLKKPMVWNEYKGIATISTEWFEGATQSIFHDAKVHRIINFNKNRC